jgi:hypothetical protein
VLRTSVSPFRTQSVGYVTLDQSISKALMTRKTLQWKNEARGQWCDPGEASTKTGARLIY